MTTKKTTAKSFNKYHADGTLWAKGKLLSGKMHGGWVWFRKDGSKMRAGSFTKGVQTGKWMT